MIIYTFTNTVATSNTYVLCLEKEGISWVIDPGDTSPIFKCLKENDSKLEGLLLTHSHYDHIYGINDLLMAFPDVKLFISQKAAIGLTSPKQNLSRYINNHQPYYVKKLDYVFVSEDSLINLKNNLVLKIIETPGHHPGCLSFSIGDNLFTGDSLIPGVKVVTILPGGDKIAAQHSIEKIFNQYGKSTRVWPGHGETCLLCELDLEDFLK